MTIIDFNKAKMIKTLNENGYKVNKRQDEFIDIPEELKKFGVNAIMSKDGIELTEDEIQAVIKLAGELKEQEPTNS